MNKIMLLTLTLGCLAAAVAGAAEAPGSATPPPSAREESAGGAKSASGAKETGAHSYTVEELYKNGATLHKKQVLLRGVAVKATSGIRGKTWTHIQDGTGDANKGSNDIICISAADIAQVGDMVTVIGTLMYNPDSGDSRYRLVIEAARRK